MSAVMICSRMGEQAALLERSNTSSLQFLLESYLVIEKYLPMLTKTNSFYGVFMKLLQQAF